ncbi:MAG: S1C family serine protease [Puniceicoccales bacterium]|nr:S1C family serine protease [Puniceicoccales bacterium]
MSYFGISRSYFGSHFGKICGFLGIVFLWNISLAKEEDVALNVVPSRAIKEEEKISLLRQESPAVFVFKEYGSAVVRVIGMAELKSNEGQVKSNEEQIREGTGFFIDDRAHVLTTASVVASAEEVWVKRGDELFAAEKIGSDEVTNVAVLRLFKQPERFTYIPYKQSVIENELEIGLTIISIGSKLGLDPGPNQGIITGSHLSYGDYKFVVPYWRTSLAMDGGEGGSPIFGSNGHFLGIMIASLFEIRASLILPAYAIQRVVDDLLRSGVTSYVNGGFSVRQDLQPGGNYRMTITQVLKDSPAEKAGLQVEDELQQINGRKINKMEDLSIGLFHTHPEEEIKLWVIRGGQPCLLSLVMEISKGDKN